MFTAGLAADILFILFLNGFYMQQIRILQKWEVCRIGQCISIFHWSLIPGDFILFWPWLLVLCSM